jgi:hypothetical protein
MNYTHLKKRLIVMKIEKILQTSKRNEGILIGMPILSGRQRNHIDSRAASPVFRAGVPTI